MWIALLGQRIAPYFSPAHQILLSLFWLRTHKFLDAYTLIKAANLETGVKNFAVIVNMADSKSVAKSSFEKFREIVMRFGRKFAYAGMMPHSKEIKHAVARRKPVTIEQPNTLVSASFTEVAKRLLKVPKLKSSLKFFDNAGVK